MSVLIKGMEMPKNCDDCVLRSLGFGKMFCPITGEDVTNQQFANNCHENCPLVEVPTPHGRLIDADALIKDLQGLRELFPSSNIDYFGGVISLVKNSPTIVEAEVSEK